MAKKPKAKHITPPVSQEPEPPTRPPPPIGQRGEVKPGWSQDQSPIKLNNPLMFGILGLLCVAFAIERRRTKTKDWKRTLYFTEEMERFEDYKNLQAKADQRERKDGEQRQESLPPRPSQGDPRGEEKPHAS